MTGPGKPQAAGRGVQAWAWALGVSLAAHVAVLLVVLLVRVPTLQLPVTPRAVAVPAPSFIKVGVLGHPPGREGGAASLLKPSGPARPRSPAPTREAAATKAEVSAGAARAASEEDVALQRPEAPATPASPVDGPASEAGALAAGPVARAASGTDTPGDSVAAGTAAGGASPGAAAGPGGAAGGASTGAAAGVGPGGAADVVSLVHARLAANAERCYPAVAKRFQQRGTVEVRFCVDAHGAVRDETVQRSSGAGVLDAAVSTCVLPAALPFPESARGACFTVPVRFGAR